AAALVGGAAIRVGLARLAGRVLGRRAATQREGRAGADEHDQPGDRAETSLRHEVPSNPIKWRSLQSDGTWIIAPGRGELAARDLPQLNEPALECSTRSSLITR